MRYGKKSHIKDVAYDITSDRISSSDLKQSDKSSANLIDFKIVILSIVGVVLSAVALVAGIVFSILFFLDVDNNIKMVTTGLICILSVIACLPICIYTLICADSRIKTAKFCSICGFIIAIDLALYLFIICLIHVNLN